jgi:hypothetical protein
MPRSRKTLPPRRQCRACGTVFYGFADWCQRCRDEGADDRSALVSIIRERRVERREGLERNRPPG